MLGDGTALQVSIVLLYFFSVRSSYSLLRNGVGEDHIFILSYLIAQPALPLTIKTPFHFPALNEPREQ